MTTLLVGFDSAWTAENSGALVGVLHEDDGRCVEIGPPIIANFAEAERIIDRWKLQLYPSTTVQFLDQPTIVRNATGQRPVENIVGSVIGRRYGGMQPASRSRTAMFGDDAPIWLHLGHFGGPLNLTEKWRGSGVIETYPALAMISFGWTLPDPKGRVTGRLPKYNPAARARFSISDWNHVCVSASKAFALRNLPIIADWMLHRSQMTKPRKHDQDALDACICLLVGIHFAEGRKCLMVGDQLTGHILVPHNSDLQADLERRCERTDRVATEWVRVYQGGQFLVV